MAKNRVYYVHFAENDYDEFDGFVIVAPSEEAALAMIDDRNARYDEEQLQWGSRWMPARITSEQWDAGFTIAEVTTDVPRLVMGSFHAG